MSIHPLALWHDIVATRDPTRLSALLARDVVFHSPVVHTPQAGRPIVTRYLAAAIEVFGNATFRYVREVVGERDAALEFTVEIDGVEVNGVDLIRWDDDSRIVDFKVMVRPLKAINLVHRRMGELLASQG